MARLIDADAMLEYLNLMYDKQNDSDEPFNCAVLGAINYIKHKAPTIEMPKWIPCSERLPSWDDYDCLVNVIAEDRTYPIILAPTYKVEDMYRNEWINAWMPLPKPYEETDQ